MQLEDRRHCPECGGVLKRKDRESLYQFRQRKYCNHSCAAKTNNRGTRRGPRPRTPKLKNCVRCGAPLKHGRKYCSRSCMNFDSKPKNLHLATKGDVFRRATNWQAARSVIQDNARKVFSRHFPKSCQVCGYTKHVEVAHLVAVKDFQDDAKISEINDPSNLVGLCPTHHWEQENDQLDHPLPPRQSGMVGPLGLEPRTNAL